MAQMAVTWMLSAPTHKVAIRAHVEMATLETGHGVQVQHILIGALI